MIEIKEDIRINKYFTLKEFCHLQGGKYIIETDTEFYRFIDSLYQFRKWYNRPININSCYRPPAYNKLIGGSKNSSHLYSLAIDFKLPPEYYKLDKININNFLENVKNKWTEITNKHGFKAQCNYYDSYIHIGFSLTTNNNYIDKRILYK